MSKCVTVPRCPDNCLALYDPVCGSDKKIYLNSCRMMMDNCGRGIKAMPFAFCIGE